MGRAANLFALASIVLLALGVIFSNFVKGSHSMTIALPRTQFAVSYEVPCYGVAALFALFACTYALGLISLNKSIINWHLWLSLSGVVLFGLGFALLNPMAEAAPAAPAQPPQAMLFIVGVGIFFGPIAFIAGQLLLAIALMVHFVVRHH